MKKFLIFLSLASLLSAQEVVSSGEVLVNGVVLTKTTKIKRGDTIETKASSSVRFNVGADAFMAKSNTKFQLDVVGKRNILNVINGGVMAVFGKGNHAITTSNMTAGIRGTGTYTLVRDGKTYFCTCYGHTDFLANAEKQDLKSTHHNMVWITKDKIKPTHDMESHNDKDLRILEAMVGRIPYFDKHGFIK